ncbi:hypothetical protein GCM10017620_11720 [Brevundimonas intermedia]|uniref:Uncharacterized protein n=1 Tax=Brevundimonas intermedia TaxID=74315 RepID=A0ABQ5T609_9CAUL|nr:hypothetical protein GCM10017620_11720 [Brevundimonas intermedia]
MSEAGPVITPARVAPAWSQARPVLPTRSARGEVTLPSFVIPGEGPLGPQTRNPAAPKAKSVSRRMLKDRVRDSFALARAAGFRVSAALRPE